ncbi:trans-sialidase, putative, partial [Trypanosoma cruzi]
LSRVAAVKTPRTHSRRRVTGSSGRRREGRESEPQRPNMSRHLFYFVLLLVVMMCCGSGGAAQAAEQASERNYKWKDIKDEVGGDVTVVSLGAPGLLNVGNDVFAVAEARCKKKDEKVFTGVASQLLKTETAKTPVEIMNEAKKYTQVLEEGTSPNNKKVDVSRPTTVVKESDIYMLVGKYDSKVAVPVQDDASDAAQLGLLLVKRSVSGGEDTNNKKIDWKGTESSPQIPFGTQLDSWTKLIGSGGSGVKMHDDTLVFPVEGTKKENKDGDAPNDGKTVSLLIYSSEDTTEI